MIGLRIRLVFPLLRFFFRDTRGNIYCKICSHIFLIFDQFIHISTHIFYFWTFLSKKKIHIELPAPSKGSGVVATRFLCFLFLTMSRLQFEEKEVFSKLHFLSSFNGEGQNWLNLLFIFFRYCTEFFWRTWWSYMFKIIYYISYKPRNFSF